MSHSPVLLLHIVSGTLGMLSGFVAIFLRKGSRRHGLAGNVFVLAMISLSVTGTYLALMKSQPGNIMGGVVTFYLVTTAWLTARRRDGQPGMFDWGALMIAVGLAVFALTSGVEAALSPSGLKYDYPPWPYFMMGSVATLAMIGDLRMLLHHGIHGTQRIARHLWRMSFALFIAASSIFMARQQIFPAFMRKTGMLMVLSFLPLALMIFWLIRVRFANVKAKTRLVVGTAERSLFTETG